jgi:UDP-N-acetyl-D-glucosamine dehydrogenase
LSTKTQTLPAQFLAEKITNRTASVAVIGLGYVGLPLVRAMHDAGFSVLGFDCDQRKIEKLQRGDSYLKHLGEDFVKDLATSSRFQASSDQADLSQAEVLILCVPSPIGSHNEPDLSYIVESTRMIAKILRPGQLVCLESTTYPGTTRGDCLPILQANGLVPGLDFFLAFSPEREDPGRKDFSTQSIPKLVGGIDPTSTELAMALYSAAIGQTVAVASAEVAEAAKLLENIYRCINIALVNELKPLLTDMGIDIWDVIGAASTKPFGFQAFWPGPGLGGHCIPIDPFYLTWKAKEFGHRTRFIELAGEINNAMPAYVVNRVAEALNDACKSVKGSRIMICGLAYKPNVDDTRETPAAEIIRQLSERGAQLCYHDPLVGTFPEMRNYSFAMSSVELTQENLANIDCVVIVTNHDATDWQTLAQHASLIVDSRNQMASYECTGTVVKA